MFSTPQNQEDGTSRVEAVRPLRLLKKRESKRESIHVNTPAAGKLRLGTGVKSQHDPVSEVAGSISLLLARMRFDMQIH